MIGDSSLSLFSLYLISISYILLFTSAIEHFLWVISADFRLLQSIEFIFLFLSWTTLMLVIIFLKLGYWCFRLNRIVKYLTLEFLNLECSRHGRQILSEWFMQAIIIQSLLFTNAVVSAVWKQAILMTAIVFDDWFMYSELRCIFRGRV